MCAMVTVVKPRSPGQPIQSAIRMKSISDEMPVMISGMIRGAVTKPEKSVRPRNLLKRARAMPAMVPRMVAIVALTRAMERESLAASMIWSFSKSLPYHWVENPPQTETKRDLLNEKTMSDRIGM